MRRRLRGTRDTTAAPRLGAVTASRNAARIPTRPPPGTPTGKQQPCVASRAACDCRLLGSSFACCVRSSPVRPRGVDEVEEACRVALLRVACSLPLGHAAGGVAVRPSSQVPGLQRTAPACYQKLHRALAGTRPHRHAVQLRCYGPTLVADKSQAQAAAVRLTCHRACMP